MRLLCIFALFSLSCQAPTVILPPCNNDPKDLTGGHPDCKACEAGQLMLHIIRRADAEVEECAKCETTCTPLYYNRRGTPIYGHIACVEATECVCEVYHYSANDTEGARTCNLNLNQVAGIAVRIWSLSYIAAFTIILSCSSYVVWLEVQRVKAVQIVGRPRSGVQTPRGRAAGSKLSLRAMMTFKMQIHMLMIWSTFLRIVWFACEGFIDEPTRLGVRTTWPPELCWLASNCLW